MADVETAPMTLAEALAYLKPDPANNGTISLRAPKAREAVDVVEAAIAAHRSKDREDGAREAVLTFAGAILHGDDEHREWLTEAGECFVEGRPLPPPRGKGTQQPLPLTTRTEDGDA